MLKARKGSKWNNTYLCQEILDMRIKRGARQYLIKWEGYEEKDNTWEPISNLIYIIDDLINFERENAGKHKQKEEEWRKMYQEKKVKDPLQPFQPSKLKKLIKIQPQPYSETDSESIAKTAKNKPIGKTRIRGGKFFQQLDIEKTAKKEREKGTARRRGRPQRKIQISQSDSKQVDIPEQKQVQRKKDFQEHSSSSSSSRSLSPQKSQFVDEHLKGIFIECFNSNNDRIQERQPSRDQQHINLQEKPQIQKINIQQDNDQLYQVLTISDKKNNQLQKVERNIIQEQIIERNQEEIPKINISQEPKIDLPQQPKKIVVEQSKSESIFKNNYSKFPLFDSNNNASLSSPLYKGVTKYIYRPQKKIVRQQKCDSQSQSFRDEALNPGFQQKPIIQLEQQQKSSTPLVIVNCKPSQASSNEIYQQKKPEDVRSQQKNKDIDIQSLHSSKQYDRVDDRHYHSKQQYSEPIYQRLRSKENHKAINSQSSSSEEQKQANDIEIHSQPQKSFQKPNKTALKLPQTIGSRYQTLKRTNQRTQSKEFPLNQFEKKQKTIHQQIIDLSASESQHSSQRSQRIKSINKPQPLPLPKTKKIKKEIFPSLYKKKQYIPIENEEYLERKSRSCEEFQPGLSAIFQMLLTVNELQCYKNAKMEKIISHFIIEKVIVFSVKVAVSKPDPQLRFATYQTIRNFFPSELLTYLQLKDCITL